MAGYSIPTPAVVIPNSVNSLRYSLSSSSGGNVVIGFGSTTTNLSYSSPPTLTVVSTIGFPDSGTISVGTSTFTYTGLTSTTFTGCTRTVGSGTITSGTTVVGGDTTTINASLPTVGNTLVMVIKLGGGITVSTIKDGSGNTTNWGGVESSTYSKGPIGTTSTYIFVQPVKVAYTNTTTPITITFSAATSNARSVFVAEVSGIYDTSPYSSNYPSISASTSAMINSNVTSYNMGLYNASVKANITAPVATASTGQTVSSINSSYTLNASATAFGNFPYSNSSNAPFPYTGPNIGISSMTSAVYSNFGYTTVFPSSGKVMIQADVGYALFTYTSVNYSTSTLNNLTLYYQTTGSTTISNLANMYPAYSLTANSGTVEVWYGLLNVNNFFPAVVTNGTSGSILTTTGNLQGTSGVNIRSLSSISYSSGSTTYTGTTGTSVLSILSSNSFPVSSTTSFPTPIPSTTYPMYGYVTVPSSGTSVIFSYLGMTSSSFTNLQLVQGSTSSTLTNGAAVTTLALPDSNEKLQLYLSKSSGASRLSLAYSTSSSPNLTLIGYGTDNIDNIQNNDILSMQNGVSVSNGIVFSIVGTSTGTTGSPQSWTVPTGSGLTLLASGTQAAFYYSTNSSIPTTTVGNLTLNWVQSQSGYFASATSVLYVPVPTVAQTLTTVESDIAAKTNSQWLNSANSILINETDNTVSTGYTQLTSANTTTLTELDNSSLVSSTALVTGQTVTSSANFTSSILSKANVLLNSISKSISVLTAKTNSQWLNSANSILINETDKAVSTNYTQLTGANPTVLTESNNSSLVSSTAVTTGQVITSSANFTSSVLAKVNVLLNPILKSISVLTATVGQTKASISAPPILVNEIDKMASTGYTQLTGANPTSSTESDNSSLASSKALVTGQATTLSTNFTSSILSKANVLLNSISKSISVLTASVAESKAQVSAPMPVVYSDQTAAVQSLSSSSGKTITLTENVLPPAISAKANLSSNAISTSFSTKVNNISFLAIMSGLAIKAKIRLVNPSRQLVKTIYIRAIGTVSHDQTYNSDNWSLPNDQDPTDFAITDEVEEFVPPMSTTYDYALDDDQDPVDFNITEGY